MTIPARTPAVRIFPYLIFAVVPLAAFLAFIIQPAMGKRLLPVFGGTSGTWLGCMVFFQLSLLLGYGWAAWLLRRPTRQQIVATASLALVAVMTFHAPSDAPAAGASIFYVVMRLSLACLPAMVLLFSASPLLHGWLRQTGGEVPYHLYAVSNTGSLLALLLYPFVVETNHRLSEQFFFWHGFLLVLTGLVAAAGWVLWRHGPAQAQVAEEPEPITARVAGLWLWLSALTCLGMLGATYHLAAEIGSNPVTWVGPLGLYLFSFMVTFSGRWQRWMTMATVVWLAISLTGFMLAKGFTAATVNAGTAWWLLSLTASGSVLGNALLHETRPRQRFEIFYLFVAAGGVAGGIFASVVLPYLLSQPVEFMLVSAALLVTGVLWLSGKASVGLMAMVAATLVIPVIGLGVHQAAAEKPNGATLLHLRDLYGHIMVKTDAQSVVLSSDTTTHGSQLTGDEAARRRPTFYYTESSAVGRTLQKLQAARPQMNVGTVGLGAGTLAAYARPGDVYDFWDIDPKAARIARENFTYVADSAGEIHLIQADGRHAIAASKVDFDVLIIDAFTGDGIPSHLLTREALTIYFERLSHRRGLLLVHTSARYSNFFPVIEATARTLGFSAISVTTEITEPGKTIDWDPSRTEYVIVGPLQQVREAALWFPEEEESGRVKHQIARVQSPLIKPSLIWSDERNAAIDALELRRFLRSDP